MARYDRFLRLLMLAFMFPASCALGGAAPHACDARQGASVDEAITHLQSLVDEIPLQGKPRHPAYEAQLRKRQHSITSYAHSLPHATLMAAIPALSRLEHISDRERFILSHLLVCIPKEDILCTLKKMHYIPAAIEHQPLAVHLYSIGITQQELSALLDDPDLHPSAIASIAIMVHQYKYGVYLTGQPLSGKLPIHKAARITHEK